MLFDRICTGRITSIQKDPIQFWRQNHCLSFLNTLILNICSRQYFCQKNNRRICFWGNFAPIKILSFIIKMKNFRGGTTGALAITIAPVRYAAFWLMEMLKFALILWKKQGTIKNGLNHQVTWLRYILFTAVCYLLIPSSVDCSFRSFFYKWIYSV